MASILTPNIHFFLISVLVKPVLFLVLIKLRPTRTSLLFRHKSYVKFNSLPSMDWHPNKYSHSRILASAFHHFCWIWFQVNTFSSSFVLCGILDIFPIFHVLLSVWRNKFSELVSSSFISNLNVSINKLANWSSIIALAGRLQDVAKEPFPDLQEYRKHLCYILLLRQRTK